MAHVQSTPDSSADVIFPVVVSGCVSYQADSKMWKILIPSILFEPILLLLALGQLPLTVRTSRHHVTNILSVLVRDSVVYFGGELTAIIANVIAFGAPTVSC